MSTWTLDFGEYMTMQGSGLKFCVEVVGIVEIVDGCGATVRNVGRWRLLPIGFQLQYEGVAVMMWVTALICIVSLLKKFQP